MAGLAETIARLSKSPMKMPMDFGQFASKTLAPFADFGTNPGQLIARSYVPADLAPGAALVVVLHGCTQSAEGYDRGAGWSRLADEAGFALLYPEQQRSNNANLCFNWFERDDVTRGCGEVASIHNMVDAMVVRHGLDPSRVYVTGLSAGGAMTSALLAAYPDIFAGGAIIAGLPFDTAQGVPEALQRMRSAAPMRSARTRDDLRAGTGHDGPWPTVSVWHGDADFTVNASNGAAVVEQWRAIHGATDTACEERVAGGTRRVWHDPAGREVIEFWSIAGMGHGTPLATGGPDACGVAGPHMLEAGISSTRHIARFWGLLPAIDPAARAVRAAPAPRTPGRGAGAVDRPRPAPAPPPSGPGAVIEQALRAAGLMK